MSTKPKIRWVRRNLPVGALPFVIGREGLPRGQKVLVFLPHSDDGRFIGTTLSLMNATEGAAPRNNMKIVVVCPGFHGVEGDLPLAAKGALRWEEALRWGEILGIPAGRMVNFNAARTYETRRCAPEDRQRMDELIASERPSMIFVPHLSDVAQHANFNTRRLALGGLARRLAQGRGGKQSPRDVLVVEYPTLHVPILPPADRNLIVVFDDPSLSLLKHRANDAHQSQCTKLFDLMGSFVEAVDALSGADDILQATRSGLPVARNLTTICLNPRESRGEHFGITRLKTAPGATEPILSEERLMFPLSAYDQRQWGGEAGKG